MFPNTLLSKPLSQQRRGYLIRRKRQQGSMLIIAIFIITVMIFIAVALQDVFDKAAKSVAYEVFGVRALNAANTGAEAVLQRIFYPHASDSALSFSGSNPEVATLNLNSTGFQDEMFNCSVAVTVEKFNVIDSEFYYDYDHYRIESTATCTMGDYTTVRTVAVEGRETT